MASSCGGHTSNTLSKNTVHAEVLIIPVNVVCTSSAQRPLSTKVRISNPGPCNDAQTQVRDTHTPTHTHTRTHMTVFPPQLKHPHFGQGSKCRPNRAAAHRGPPCQVLLARKTQHLERTEPYTRSLYTPLGKGQRVDTGSPLQPPDLN